QHNSNDRLDGRDHRGHEALGADEERAELMKPTVGRIVHYTNLGDKDGRYPPETQAAIITGVNEDGTCALKIFYRTGMFDMPAVPHAEISTRGHWNWPPRES